MIFLDRNARQMADAAGLLRGIHAEMDRVRRRQLGFTFIWGLRALRALPGGLAGRVQNGRCEATCVLSNLGRVLAASPLPRRRGQDRRRQSVAGRARFFSPVREGTAASVGLVFYRGELQVCLRYDSRQLTVGQADDLLTMYLHTIHASTSDYAAAVSDRAA